MSQYDGPKGWWISENKKWIIRHCDRKWNIGDVEDIRMTQWCEVIIIFSHIAHSCSICTFKKFSMILEL